MSDQPTAPETAPAAPAEPFRYSPKSDDEVREIALGILSRRIFTDRDIPDAEGQHMLARVFFPLMFADQIFLDRLKALPLGLIFEEMHKAGPRSTNGCPNFFSMQILNVADTERVIAVMKQIEDATKNAAVPPAASSASGARSSAENTDKGLTK